MAEVQYQATVFVSKQPEQKSETDEWGNERPLWQVNVTAGPGETWGPLLVVADPKAAEVLRANVGKAVRVTCLAVPLPKRAGGAWLKLNGLKVEPAS